MLEIAQDKSTLNRHCVTDHRNALERVSQRFRKKKKKTRYDLTGI